jgi:hypothetical protein
VSLGDQLRAAGRILNHPIIQAAGNALTILTLTPFVIAGVVALVGRMTDEPALFVVSLCLALIGMATVVVLALLQRRHPAAAPKKMIGPEERRERLDNILGYRRRDDRRELGEQCAFFAMKMRVFNEEQEWKRERTIARFAKEAREANSDLDPLQARRDAEDHFARNVVAAYAFEMREEALQLFDKAREFGEIEARARRIAERPLAVEMREVPNLFVVLARRLDPDGMESRQVRLSQPRRLLPTAWIPSCAKESPLWTS